MTLSGALLVQTIASNKTLTEQQQQEEEDQNQNEHDKKNSQQKLFRPRVPYPEWDYNWDGRMTTETTPEVQSTIDGFRMSKAQGKTTRHIILIRHGQYDMSNGDDGRLTPLGRRQAQLTGQRIALLARGGLGRNSHIGLLGGDDDEDNGHTTINVCNDALSLNNTTNYTGPCYIKAIHVSNMERAKETASIIASHLIPHNNYAISNVDKTTTATTTTTIQNVPDPLLNETLPANVIPCRPDLGSFEINQDNVEQAFHKYFYRAIADDYTNRHEHNSNSNNNNNNNITPPEHEFEIIVGHANMIRYFVCRALQLPPEAWLRMSLFNCSITYLVIQPNGHVTARLIGDTGHIPYEDTSFSESLGYNWHSH